MEQLKSHCPFCGSNGDISESQWSSGRQYEPYCTNCMCSPGIYDSYEEAVAAWEHRSDNWIPIGERPPEIGEQVIVMPRWGGVVFRTYHGPAPSGQYDTWKNVVAWMPSPKPYTEETKK